MSDKRMDKIIALLKQAEGTNHPEEAKTFTAKAQALMTEWEIDEAQLAERAAKNGGPVELPADHKVWIPYSPYQTSHIQVWLQAYEAQGCKAVWLSNSYNPEVPSQKGGWLHVFGFQSSITIGSMLGASLAIQAETEFRTDGVQYRMFAQTSHPGHRIKWKNSFLLGYAAGVGKQLADAKAAAMREAGTGAELVFVGRAALVQDALNSRYNRLRKGNTSAGGYAGATNDGYRAGLRAKTSPGSNEVGGGSGRKSIG